MDTQEMKTCTACLVTLPLTKFKRRSSKSRQAGQYTAQCSKCLYIKYTRPSNNKKYEEVRQYKLDKGCADCGYKAHAEALQFDHVNSEEKLFNIGEKIHLAKSTLWLEIEKCDVVCANCHAIRTSNRRVMVGF